MGDGSLNDNGELVVESLTPNTQNSVDLVSYAGRPGSGLAEKLYESALAAFNSSKVEVNEADTAPPIDKGTSTMDPLEEIKGMIAELPALVAAAVSDLNMSNDEHNMDAQGNPVAAANSAEPMDVASVAEAMLAADLPEVSRKAVYESLRNGVELNEAIESQKAFVESIKLSLKEAVVAPAAAAVFEETLVVNSKTEKATSFLDILNVKVGS
jgi:hypothetical protein